MRGLIGSELRREREGERERKREREVKTNPRVFKLAITLPKTYVAALVRAL